MTSTSFAETRSHHQQTVQKHTRWVSHAKVTMRQCSATVSTVYSPPASAAPFRWLCGLLDARAPIRGLPQIYSILEVPTKLSGSVGELPHLRSSLAASASTPRGRMAMVYDKKKIGGWRDCTNGRAGFLSDDVHSGFLSVTVFGDANENMKFDENTD